MANKNYKYESPRNTETWNRTLLTDYNSNEGATPFDFNKCDDKGYIHKSKSSFIPQNIIDIKTKNKFRATNKFFCRKYNATERAKEIRKRYRIEWYSDENNRKKHSDYYKARRPHMNELTHERLLKRRKLWIERLGGICKKCGKPIDESIDDLRAEFHHQNREAKRYNVSCMFTRYNEDKIWDEIKRGDVILLHKKCHRLETNNQLYVLTDEQAAEVMRLWQTNMYTQEELALRFGCSDDSINRIVNNKTKRADTIKAMVFGVE